MGASLMSSVRSTRTLRWMLVGSYKVYIDGRLKHHGSLWTTKPLDTRHRQHLKNCVLDSLAWEDWDRDREVQLAHIVEQLVGQHLKNCVMDSLAWEDRDRDREVKLADIVEQLVQKFGEYEVGTQMYYRLHEKNGRHGNECGRSVKIFIGSPRAGCMDCQHCEAYDFLNGLLGCNAQHGPSADWASQMIRRKLEAGSGTTTPTAG